MDIAVRKPGRKKEKLLPYLLLLPTLLLIIVFLLIPLGFAVYCSLFRCDYMQFTRYLGIGNYVAVLTDKQILDSVGRSFFVSGISLAFAMVLGMILSKWINASRGKAAYFLQINGLIDVGHAAASDLVQYPVSAVQYAFSHAAPLYFRPAQR